MRSNADDPSRRYLEAARWYLPPMGGEPEPDPTLACTYALLAVYTKLDALLNAMPTDTGGSAVEPDAGLDPVNLLRTLGVQPPAPLRKGFRHN